MTSDQPARGRSRSAKRRRKAQARRRREFLLERRALGLSIVAGLVLATIGITIGIITASQIILFDGFYTFLGIGISWMALRASHLVAIGPTVRYPFGREALTPLIIGVEGVALLATCCYATFDAVLTIVHGGARIPNGWGLAYAVVALLLSTGIWWRMRRSARQLELVSAEAMGWLAGGLLGFAMLVAFIFARLIRDTSWAPVAHYVDPGLVIVTCLAFVVPPLQMIRTTFFELVEGTPDTELNQPAREAVDKVAADYALTEHHLRMTKIGRKFYVEIDFVVAPEWTVWQSDQVRRDLSDTLDQLHLDLWLTLEFTADHSWGL